MRQNEIAAKEGGVSNCLILCPPWKSSVECGSVLGRAKRKAVQLGLPPLLVLSGPRCVRQFPTERKGVQSGR